MTHFSASRCFCCLMLLLLILVVFAVESKARVAPTASPGHQRTTPHHHRHGNNRHHPRPSSRPVAAIARPGECSHDAIFADCFMCGRVNEEREIYIGCCMRDETIIRFCEQYL